MPLPTLSHFANSLTTETAFDVLAVAKRLKAGGKDVIELQIGDSPFPSSSSALAAGKQAIDAGATRYCPSLGLPEFRETIAATVKREFGIPATADHIVVGPGAKVFETFFCEAFLEPGDEVLLFSPQFPTYEPNIARRGGVPVYANLTLANAFRPDPADVEKFIKTSKRPKAIFLNSPHNPTGGVATHDDLKAIANLIRGKNIAVLSDEPYCHMVWEGKHHSHPRRTRHDRSGHGRVHVQQELQHERLALRLHRHRPGHRPDRRQDDQHVALLRAADRAVGRQGGPRTGHRRTRRHDGRSSTRRSNCW